MNLPKLKSIIFKLYLFLQCFIIQSFDACANDSLKRNKLLPDHIKIQFAGGIGFFSLGAGYSSANEKFEGDFYYGYVPESIGGLTIHSLTSKITWLPVKAIPVYGLRLKPFTTGLLINYTFGKQYFGFTPDNYPYNYYNHPTNLHIGFFLGGQLRNTYKPQKKIKQMALYYELITFDTELISFVKNTRTIKIHDIINLGLGLKANL
jgi:hypothetical protein